MHEIFRSGSGGIVAAKKTADGAGLLAVADSEVVLLHDIKKGMQKSYRLKGTDVSPWNVVGNANGPIQC